MSSVYQVTSAPGQPLETTAENIEGLTPTPRRNDEIAHALGRKAIMISASENIPRDGELDRISPLVHAHYHGRLASTWPSQLLTATGTVQYPRRVVRAVTWLCSLALAREYTLVFGGHPAISPMVLEVARRHVANHRELRVVIFQSACLREVVTKAARDLAQWRHGCMLITKGMSDRTESLTLMRRHMMGSPGLEAGVFIGGMSALLEESQLFTEIARKPKYAIGSTGGAASFLLDAMPTDHGGRCADPELIDALRSERSYAAVADRIFEDI